MLDVIIIGAGPAGITAGIYAKRSNLEVILLDKKQSSLKKAEKIENYYGFEKGISGEKLYNIGINQAENIGIDIKKEEVIKIEEIEKGYLVKSESEEYLSKTVILATGNKRNRPKIDGIEKFEGKGISYCAVCDGFFYRNKNIGILGNGSYAISETNDLLNIANNIIILTNGEEEPNFRADNVNIDTRKIKSIKGKQKVEEIEFEDGSTKNIEGLFIAQGVAGSSDFAKKLGIILKEDKIVVDEDMQTNIRGIYACGDCTGGIYQISKAVYEGTKAGLAVIKYLRQEKI